MRSGCARPPPSRTERYTNRRWMFWQWTQTGTRQRRAQRGRPQRLLRRRERLDGVPAHRVRSALVVDARPRRTLPPREIARRRWQARKRRPRARRGFVPPCLCWLAGLAFSCDLPGAVPGPGKGRLKMAKGQMKSNKEAKKPKKEKPKVLATAGMTPSRRPPARRNRRAVLGSRFGPSPRGGPFRFDGR